MRKAFTLLSTELQIEDPTEIDTIVYLVMRFEAELVLLQSKENYQIFGFPDEMEKYVKIPSILHSNFSPKVSLINSDSIGIFPVKDKS
jgi:hypothetical protein